MRFTVIPNLHPSAVIRNKRQWESLFNQTFQKIRAYLDNHSQTNSSIITSSFIKVTNENFRDILQQLKHENYKLVDVQRYKDIVGDQIVDQGFFAIFTNGKDRKYVVLDDIRFFYYAIDPKKQSPEPLLDKQVVSYEQGPTVKEILVNGWKSVKLRFDEVYYNVDFSLDDWLVYQIKI